MKATLTFDLDIIDDHTRHIQCVKANDMAVALWHIKQAMYKANDDHHLTTFLRINSALEDVNIEEICP